MRAEERESKSKEALPSCAENSMKARQSPLLDVIGACIISLGMLLNYAPVCESCPIHAVRTYKLHA